MVPIRSRLADSDATLTVEMESDIKAFAVKAAGTVTGRMAYGCLIEYRNTR